MARRQDMMDAAYAPEPEPQYYAPPPAPAPAPEPAVDPYVELKKLGELHAQGILTDEEFAAQKAKILGS
jgi:hypothetical protein